MPSQQYEPPNREATVAPSSDPPTTQDRSSQDQPTQDQPTQDQPTQEQPTQEQPTQEQPAQWAGAGEQTPGTQSQQAYGSYGAAPAYDAGPGWSQPADQPARGYDPSSSDPDGYDPNAYDPNRYPSDRSDLDGSDAGAPTDSDAVRAREKEAFGGVKLGAAFFGWLTAVGATVVLIAIVAAVASALDVSTDVDGTATSQDPSTLGLGKIIAGLGILFVAYYVGGYVAGRMARFNGARQGLAVWLWAVLIAAALTLLGILFDSNNDLARDVSLPDFRIDIDTVTTETLIAVGIVLAVTLVGAIVGGLAGMRFHRRVDRAGFAPIPY